MAVSNSTRSGKKTTGSVLVPVIGPKSEIRPIESIENEGYTVKDCISAAEKIAVHWWTILNESHFNGDFPKSYGGKEAGTHSDIDEHSKWLSMAKRLEALGNGESPDYRYEVWTSREHRLEGGFEFFVDADREKQKWLTKFPDAFIARVSTRCPRHGINDLSLLDTMVGRIWWAGTFSHDDDKYDTITVQDDTGRCVDVRADALMNHSIWDRLSPSAKERIQFDVDRANRKEERKLLNARAGESGNA